MAYFKKKPFRQFGGPREMHKITCAECGNEAEVPFKPREGTPVLCKECYFKKKGITPRKPVEEEKKEEKVEESEEAKEEENEEDKEEEKVEESEEAEEAEDEKE